ncbi:uncharacterized protein E5676_scaffold129G00830 [Cucumis melo var. makuwa]|uniref:Retrotransposon gag domain-containing protein n=1 Tax=Cucumis melo var. makuwa TaxID=1194695 RepID=A0A5D3E0M3_CUCMM|nr:uncharacterized protein E6C27_scaffold110G001980 [Cucumis melo var. makuwa]TYK29364.1 uncharacterized protein E5676_scaffold129G00830 [Cucumis melo var. makuwa]
MLYLVKVSNSIRFLESRFEEIAEKTDMIDAVAGCVEGLPIQELLARVDTLEGNIVRTGSHEHGNSSTGSVAHIKERKCNRRCECETENLTMRAMKNQAPTGGAIPYFRVTNTVTEEAKVMLATMHLTEDTKLWWRSRYVDMQEGHYTIDTWDALKRELRSQFFPENVEILARRKLRKRKYTNNIWEYMKQFVGLMLDLRDMSEKDKVFCFVEGLKPWAKTKLYEQRV